jgi:acyl-CoA thioesterase-1
MARLARVLPVLAVLSAVACERAETPQRQDSAAAESRQAGAHARDVASAPPAALPRIVFLGDSLTAGLGIGRDQAVPALIQQRLRREGYAYDVVNAGNSGDTSDGGLTRLDWSLSGEVAVLVIELGANDGLRGIAPERTRANLESIVTTAKRRGITVLLTGMEAPPNYGPAYTAEFRETFRQVAAKEHVALMPFFLEGVAGIASLNQPDGVHPTPEGARIVADNLWRYLEPLLMKTQS